jgi:hypothetical protein
MSEAVDFALAAFWSTVSELYPEASTGDLYAEHEMPLVNAAIAAVAAWVELNVGAPSA